MRWVFAILGVVSMAPRTFADHARLPESPLRVSTCQLENHPSLYNRKLVEVHGQIYFGKFDFEIESRCKPHGGARVWIDFGGDVVAPSAYWGIASSLSKQKGVEVRVKGVAVPIVHDRLLDQFVNDVAAIRFRKPNGNACGSECLFYSVTATLRGRFFSGTKDGFGMEECCHLLVIERVLNVSSKRTGVPAGGEFECTSDVWQPTPEELKALSVIPGCSLRASFNSCFVVLAKHRGDDIQHMPTLDYPGPWMSRDMTLSYVFQGNFISNGPGQPTEMTPSSSVVRQVCRAVLAPKPPADHVKCEFQGSVLDSPGSAATAPQAKTGMENGRASSDIAQAGWLAYENANREWKLAMSSPIGPAKCEALPPFKDDDGNTKQWGYCSWFSRDDLQQITVHLHRPAFAEVTLGEVENMPWVPIGVEANLCRTESPLH